MARAATHPTWGLGFGDEVWWSRLAQPARHAWTPDGQALRLGEHARPKDDPAPKALACSGLLVRHVPRQPAQMLLRFVEGRPVRAKTSAFLAWCSNRLAAPGFTAVLWLWENASWHKSYAVRAWLRQHHHGVKQTGQGVRILVCRLPTQSPWLNPIEPKWVHGKRAIVEPDRVLSAQTDEAHLVISQKAA